MLRVSNLSFAYRHSFSRRTVILQDISFTLDSGQCLVIAGSNGCGKSTLLSLLTGALPLAEGTVETDGERLGLVPQGFSVFEDLTVRQNLQFFAKRSGGALTRPLPFGLEPYADQKAGILSGGLKKRLCIACTAAARPDIWLFDEPCASLDILWRDEMIRTICRLKEQGRGILYVGHDPAEFTPFYDAVLLLRDGRGTTIPRETIPPGTEEDFLRERLREGPHRPGAI